MHQSKLASTPKCVVKILKCAAPNSNLHILILKKYYVHPQKSHESLNFQLVSCYETLIQKSHFSLQIPENALKPKNHLQQCQKNIFIFLDMVAK
jgi:hypothetical protein